MGEKYETTHQYEPIRVPSGWTGEERRLIMQLTELFDDLYRRFNRLRFEDFGSAFQERIENTEGDVTEVRQSAQGLIIRVNDVQEDIASLELTAQGLAVRVEDAEGAASEALQTAQGLFIQVNDVRGDVASLALTTAGMAAAVNNNRLRFSAMGLEIINAQGVTVFKQDNASGDLTITGHIQAQSGRIGGFLIEPTSLSNGSSIVLSSEGYVRLGKLVVTDDPHYGPVLRGDGGLCVMVNGSLYSVFADGKLTTQVPLDAKFGLLANPQKTTNQPANVYMDPVTGELLRTTTTSGIIPPDGSALSATLSVNKASVYEGESVTITCAASGGQTPYTYQLSVSVNGGPFNPVSGSGGSRVYAMNTVGVYYFSMLITDSASHSYQAFSGAVQCERRATAFTARVEASKTNVTPGSLVTFTILASGGSGTYRYYAQLGKDSVLYDSTEGMSTITYTLSQPGNYQLSATVYDNETNDFVQALSPVVSVISATQYVTTKGTNVNIRSGPGTTYSIVGTIIQSGTQVQITGGPENGFYQIWWSAGGLSGWISGTYLNL